MIGYFILLSFLLTLASTQTLPDYCPYFPKDDSIHCSQMCVPFRLGEPYGVALNCYSFAIKETLRFETHVEVTLVRNPDGSCDGHNIIEMAVQAIDGDGYPIGQWEAAVGKAGLSLFKDHCKIDDKAAWIKILLPQNYSGTSPPPADLPTVTVHPCHESPSLRKRLDDRATKLGIPEIDVPTYVRYSHSREKAKSFAGLGLLWHHDYKVSFNVTFIAEVFYYIRSGPDNRTESTIHQESYEYKPRPLLAPLPPDKKVICFDGLTGPIARARGYIIYENRPTVAHPTIHGSRIYLDELNAANALGAFTTTTTTTTTTGPTPSPVVVRTPRPPLVPPPVIKGKNTPPHILQPPPPEATVAPKVEQARKDIFERCQLTKKCLASSTMGVARRSDQAAAAILLERNICIGESSCIVMLSYGDAEKDEFEIPDDYVYIEMIGRSNSYVAVALSHDNKMGDDFVVECVRNPNTSIQIHASWNTARAQSLTDGRKPDNMRLDETYEKEKFLILHDSGYVVKGGYLFCKFSIKKELFYKDPLRNMTRFPFNVVTTLYYILMTVGGRNDDASANLKPHVKDAIWETKFRVAIGSRFSPTSKQQRLIHGHGQIMYFVFVFVYPNAIFIARYYKETFIKRRLFGMRDWHLVHVILQSTGLVFIVFGHVFLTYANEGWSNPNPSKSSVIHHSWTSLATAAFYLFNLFLGLLDRERAFGDACDFCHWLHAVLGHVIYFFGMAALITAEKVQYSDLPCYSSELVASWTAIYIIFQVVMSLHHCWIDWVVGVAGRTQRIGPLDLLVQPEAVEVAPGKWLRIAVLILFITVSGVFTIALIALGGVAKKGTACQTIEYFIELYKS